MNEEKVTEKNKTSKWKKTVTENLIGITVVTTGIVFILLIVGLPFFVVHLCSTPMDLSIEPEYISGILAASSILFGFWAVATGGFEEWHLRGVPSTLLKRIYFGLILLTFNLGVLVLGVICIFLSIIGVLPALISLCMLVSSFNLNCLLLLSYLFRVEIRISVVKNP